MEIIMNNEGDAFTYLLMNLDTEKTYVGYHLGDPEDGYLCSSKNPLFWEDLNSPEHTWIRVITSWGTLREAQEEELRRLKLSGLGDHTYNLCVAGSINFTPEVRQKMSASAKQRDLSYLHTKEVRAKAGLSMRGHQHNLGNTHTEKAKKAIGDAQRGKLNHNTTKVSLSKVGSPLMLFDTIQEASEFLGVSKGYVANVSRRYHKNSSGVIQGWEVNRL